MGGLQAPCRCALILSGAPIRWNYTLAHASPRCKAERCRQLDVEICTIQDQRAVGYPRTGAIDNHSLAPDKINNIDTDPRNTATNVVFGPVGTELAMSIGSVIGIELI